MRIHVSYEGTISAATGVERETIETVPDATVAVVLGQLLVRHGAELAGVLVDRDERIAASLELALDEVPIDDPDTAVCADGVILTLRSHGPAERRPSR